MKLLLSRTFLKNYFSLCRKHKRAIFCYSMTLVVLAIVQVVIPITTAQVLDTITELNQFFVALTATAVLWLIDQVFYYLACSSYSIFLRDCFIDMNQKIVNKVYNFTADRIINLPRGKIVRMSVGDAFDIAEMMEYITDIPFNGAMNMVMIILLFITDWRFGAIVLATSVAYFILATWLTRRATKHYAEQQRSTDKLIDLLNQTLDGIREVKTYNLQNNINKKFDRLYQNFSTRYMIRRKYHVHYQVTLRYIMYAVRIVIYIIAAFLLMTGDLSLGIVVMIINYASTIFEQSYSTMESVNELRRCKVSFYRIWNFLRSGEITARRGSVNIDKIDGKVQVKNVSFRYVDLPTLRHISFTALPRSVTVIVGKTGSGKTSIFNLLLRLYLADSGKITIDGIPLEDFSDEVFYQNVATVNQEGFLFDMTIRENLALVNSSEIAQIEACKRVGIHDFIMSLPKGYSTKLTKNSANLSGGQRRLLALAKALLSNAEILLVDEVDSSLDSVTTKKIANVLKDLGHDHTVIVITHKRELMNIADKLIRLDNGRIVHSKTHRARLS